MLSVLMKTATVLAMLLAPVLASAEALGIVRISLVQGDVQIRTEDSGDWVPAAPNTPVQEGDSIWCPAGARAEVQFRDGMMLRLDGHSAVDIVALDEDLVQLHQGMGRIYMRVGKEIEGRIVQLDLPTTTIQVNKKARFRVDIADDGDEEIAISRGSIYAESRGTRTRLRTGEMLTVDENSSEIAPLKAPDEWDRWNEGRDNRGEKRESVRYLPPELETYASDLDGNGDWLYEPEYGNIWRPTVMVGADWSPYRAGRWCWIGGDYVWIPSEPWGWTPYHYGRWTHHPRFGWCWVPPPRGEVYWSPGYVGWVVTGDYVGWVPLAPGETYYGYGHFGPGSVNVASVTVGTPSFSISFRNVTVHNSVTVVNRTSFLSGKVDVVKGRENIFTHRGGAHGPPPRFQHDRRDRSVFMPAVKKIPEAKLPPPRLRDVRARELKDRLPLARVPEQRKPKMEQGHRVRETTSVPATRPMTSAPGASSSEQRGRTDVQRLPERRDVRPSTAAERQAPGGTNVQPLPADGERKGGRREPSADAPRSPVRGDQSGALPESRPPSVRTLPAPQPAPGPTVAPGRGEGRSEQGAKASSPARRDSLPREVRKSWSVHQKEAPAPPKGPAAQQKEPSQRPGGATAPPRKRAEPLPQPAAPGEQKK